jgi:N-acetylmuramoyl-L-alanine amidase
MNKILSIVFCLLLSSAVFAQSKIILVVDAGHGGADPGAQLPTRERESDYTLDMANVVADYARQAGFTVVMTRKRKDEFLTHHKRSGFKRAADPAYFVSLHLDQDRDASKKGGKLYYYKKSTYGVTSRILAEKIGKGLGQLIHSTPVIEDKDAIVLTNNEMASVMVYVGYMTNKEDFARAKTSAFQKQLAAVIVNAIKDTKYDK